MAYKRLKFIIILLLAMLAVGAKGLEVSTESWRDYFKPGHTKEEITKRFNLHGGKWWNYYARGRWYAEGGYYDEAIQDFKICIKVRSKDHGFARSYGMHFCEYFAHRELGIVYYDQGKYEEAKKELETSLATADSAKAKFYLNKGNEAILKMTKSDLESPQIKITSHTDGEVVNTPIAKIKGVAMGNGCINYITVRGKRLFIELAEKKLDFSEDVPLHVGENVISLEARDLLGKSARQDFKLKLDMRPPTLYLNDIQVHRKDGKNIATIKGTVVDDYGIKSLSINDTAILLSSDREVEFEQDAVLPDSHKISFRVVDKAGNETRGEHLVDKKTTLWPVDILGDYYSMNTPIRVAANKLDGYNVRALLASQDKNTSQPPPVSSFPEREKDRKTKVGEQDTVEDRTPPVIHTNAKSAIVYDANFFFNGDVHDDNGVAGLFVNQHPIEIRPGKHIFFNHLFTLHDGENIITVTAIDAHGNETQLPPLKITKKTFELLEMDARYTVALLPLKITAVQEVPTETLYYMLLKAFDEDPKRFKFVEIDQAKVKEMFNEPKKMIDAEGVLLGNVEEEAKGINVMLRLVDTETNQVLANADVYDEDKSAKNLKWLMYCLSLKMKQQFPMVQGKIVQVSGNGIFTDAGASSGVKAGMKLLLYRERKEGEFVLKEPLDTVARVVQVQPDTAFARIINAKEAIKIEKSDFVITK